MTAKKIVELVGEPSYTSGDHIWRGAAAILKKNAAPTNKRAILIDSEVEKVLTSTPENKIV